ncbi:hypothetical protein JCM6882_001389 [Rhodosporidiobolus microsporus]
MPARARARRALAPAVVLFALAALSAPPPARASDLIQLPKHLAPSRAVSPLEARQLFGGIFGGGDDDDDSTTSAASDTATGASSGTGAGASASASASVSVPSIGASSASSAATTDSASSAASASSASSTPSSASSTPSSASSTPSSSSASSTSSASQVIVTVTSILTNSDGSESTMLSASVSALSDKDGGGGGGPSGKTWGIIGGVIGGVLVVAGILLVVWRMTQRRFSDLDHDNDAIKWPELHAGDQTVSPGLTTLNPQGTRRTGGAGFEMEKDRFGDDDDDRGSEWGAGSPRLGAVGAGGGLRGKESAYFEREAPYEVQYAGAAGMGGQRGSYYDPYLGGPPPHVAGAPQDSYLGPSAAPYPPPPSIQPAHNLYPPQPLSSTPSPSPAGSPYMYPDAAATNGSFSSSAPHLHLGNPSAEDMPLTAAAGGIPYRPQAASPGPHDIRY